MAVGRSADDAFATHAPRVASGHVRRRAKLVEEYELIEPHVAEGVEPTGTRGGDVGPGLLAGVLGLFFRVSLSRLVVRQAVVMPIL